MTGISDLNAVFGSSTRVSDPDGDALSLGSLAKGKNENTIAEAGNQSLLNSDQTVVSTAGGAMSQAMETSDVRTDKVASLQVSIANGTYNVSSADVADKLISSMLDEG
jgi:negative regulator of flagellin synthesis FlgM